jgi:phage major head subunit gpT-like protein
MDITASSLTSFFQGLNTRFRAGVSSVRTYWPELATVVPSNTKVELHRWMAQVPQLEEWVGERVARNIATDGFSVINKKYTQTIEIERDDIEDDSYGIYAPLAFSMGQVAARHPDKLIATMLNSNTDLGYDGKALLATDHPNGKLAAQSNYDNGGAGPRWYLINSTQALRFALFQQRKALEFKEFTNPDEKDVFDREVFTFGTRVRYRVAPGFWQTIFASNRALDASFYESAYEAYLGLVDVNGEPFGFELDTLMVPTTLRAEALELIQAERDAAGATNINRNSVRNVIVNPWLSKT